MTAADELRQIAADVLAIEGRFQATPNWGPIVCTEDATSFSALVADAQTLLETELGNPNQYSANIAAAIWGITSNHGPSLVAVQKVRKFVEGGVKQIQRLADAKASLAKQMPSPLPLASYVATTRIEELRDIVNPSWDLRKLVRLLEELNTAHASGCLMTTAILVRAIKDHVPPLFGMPNFDQVANNAASGNKSFRGSAQNLENSLKHIADSFLHVHVRKSDALPAASQVDFRRDLDVLLGEVVRLARP